MSPPPPPPTFSEALSHSLSLSLSLSLITHYSDIRWVLATLGDLEEISRFYCSANQSCPERFMIESVVSACSLYSNLMVYPHSMMAGLLYRSGRHREALQSWLNAAAVLSG